MALRDTARRLVRRIAWPVWRRAWGRLELRLVAPEQKLALLERQIHGLTNRVAETEGHLGKLEKLTDGFGVRLNEWQPALLAATTAVGRIGQDVTHFGSRIRELGGEVGALGAEISEGTRRGDLLQTEIQKAFQQLTERSAHLEAEMRTNGRRLEEEISSIKTKTEVEPDQHSVNHLLGEIAKLWKRIEFVRQEIMLEARYGDHPSTKQVLPLQSKIVNAQKLQELKASGLKLNVGCGHIPFDDYINVDQRELPGVDIVAGAANIPVQPGTVQELYSAHLVEHFPHEEFRRSIAPHWHSLLADGGLLRTIAPDGRAMLQGAAEGAYSFAEFREALFGGQEYNGDFHYNLFTPESFTSVLESVGFTNIKCIEAGRRNGTCFEFEIVATKAVA